VSFSNIGNLNLGSFLQIAFSEGVTNQMSEEHPEWEAVQQIRVGNPDGKHLEYLLQKSYGPAAIQYRNPNFSSSFPSGQQITTATGMAVYKECAVTVELEQNLIQRAMKSPSKYAEPLAFEIQAKTIAAKRRRAADYYGDGTGVVGRVASVADTTGASGYAEVTLNTDNAFSGHVGFFEEDDLLLAYEADGTAATAPTVTGTFYAWRVKEKNRTTDKVKLEAINSAGTVLALTASNLASTDYFYRVGQPSIPNRSSISDWGSATEVMVGLEALAARDGRTVNGVALAGALGGSVKDCDAAQIDVSLLHDALDQAKMRVGRGKYKYSKAMSAPETVAALINSRETDRRFTSVQDNKRGVSRFAYIHENDTVEFHSSEFCPKKRMWIAPETASGKNKALEFHGTDYEAVKLPGMSEMHLKPSADGGHERRVVSYMQAIGTFVCKQPSAIISLQNFIAS
jgi:hypothetical protein